MKKIGQYEVVAELARGAMGVVYRAREPALGRDVALKRLHRGVDASGSARGRFAREARALARLSHPNIVAVHFVGEDQGAPFLVMDLVEGTTLATILQQRGALPPREAMEVTRKLARALAHAHGIGIVHRDVKPANVLIGADGEPRLTDFGLAKDTTVDASTTAALSVAGGVLGTPGFWPPEQAKGELDRIGPRSDVFALGATLYAMLTGGPPYAGATLMEVVHAMQRPPAPPSAANAAVDPALDALVLRCLDPDPEERPAGMSEVIGSLDLLLRASTPARGSLPPALLVAGVLVGAIVVGATVLACLRLAATKGQRDELAARLAAAEDRERATHAGAAAAVASAAESAAELERARAARDGDRGVAQEAAAAAARRAERLEADLARARLEALALRSLAPDVRQRLEARAAGFDEAAREPARVALLAAGAGRPWAELVVQADAAVAASPRSPDPHLLRARLALGRDEYAAARESLALARELGGPADQVTFMEGEALFMAGDGNAAVALWDALARRGSGTLPRLSAAWGHSSRREPEACRKIALEVLEAEPTNTTAMALLAGTFLRPEHPQESAEAVALCDRALAEEGALVGRMVARRAGAVLTQLVAKEGPADSPALDAAMQALIDTFPIAGVSSRVSAIRRALKLGTTSRWFPMVPVWLADARLREPGRAELDVYAGAHLAVAGEGTADDVLACWRAAKEKQPKLRVPEEWLETFRRRFGAHPGLAEFTKTP